MSSPRERVRPSWATITVVTAFACAFTWLLQGCGGFDAGPLACRFDGDYLITATATDPEACESWTMRRHFAGSFALGCSPELGIAGYAGTVTCQDESGVAMWCSGQLSGDGCSYELQVERE
jgi:hypothetical protein